MVPARLGWHKGEGSIGARWSAQQGGEQWRRKAAVPRRGMMGCQGFGGRRRRTVEAQGGGTSGAKGWRRDRRKVVGARWRCKTTAPHRRRKAVAQSGGPRCWRRRCRRDPRTDAIPNNPAATRRSTRGAGRCVRGVATRPQLPVCSAPRSKTALMEGQGARHPWRRPSESRLIGPRPNFGERLAENAKGRGRGAERKELPGTGARAQGATTAPMPWPKTAADRGHRWRTGKGGAFPTACVPCLTPEPRRIGCRHPVASWGTPSWGPARCRRGVKCGALHRS